MSKHRCLFTGLCVLLVLAPIAAKGAAFAGSPPQRDVWYCITDGQQRYGSMHVVVRHVEDGNVEFALTSRVMVEFMGTRQVFDTSATSIVSPDLAPLRMESDAVQMTGCTSIAGHATEEGFVLETQRDGQTDTSTLKFDDGLDLVFNVAVGDWLHRSLPTIEPAMKPANGPADSPVIHRVRVLDVESGEPIEITVRLLEHDADGSRWSLETDEQWNTMTLQLDAEGVTIEPVVSAPPMRIERASMEDALRIDYRVMPERELLMFPLDRELPPTRRLQRLDVKLTWNDISPDEFQLEDSRQQVKSITSEGDRHAAIVSLVRSGDALPDVALPVRKETFESTLAPTDFITPDDERIAALALEIVGEQTSALAATKAISSWVHDYIEPAMVAETLSGAQVLERRKGKCTEYSTLFASLARAAGLPTRIALGQRRFPGAKGEYWGGHMWNEVFIGQWVPVDASANEVGGSLDLLKFIHSDTVMGTQPLRWKLTESLEVSIAEVELVEGAAALTTGLHEQTYTNAEYGFRFRLPDAAWTIEHKPSPGALVLRLRSPDDTLGDSVMLHVTAFNVPAGMPAQTMTDARIPSHQAGLDQFEILVNEATEINGASGHRLGFQGVPRGDNAVPLRVTEVLLVSGETGALLNLIATRQLHESHIQTFEAVLATFRFIDD